MQQAGTEIAARTLAVVDEWRGAEGPLLPILHGVQEEFGYIPSEALPVIAGALNLSRADVHGVMTFYHDFREHPAGRHVLKLCQAESCQSMGSDEVAEKVQKLLGIGFHETTKDGSVTLEPVYCLGLCACSPSAMLDGEVIGRLDDDRIDEIVAGGAVVTVTLYIPRDSGALALGAEKVAKAIAKEIGERKIDARIVRNGSRGLYWLEPMVEVETDEGRVAYGPVGATDVPSLFDADFLSGGKHALSLGDPEKIPFLAKQTRLTFARCGITDPVSLDDYRAHGGLAGLEKALKLKPVEIVAQVTESGLRGRGGAGFPTGIKWKTVLDTPGERKYIVCNADEGDSGTFSDRMIMEGDPFVLIEGMTIAGIAVGATKGYIYLRSEYPHAGKALNEAIAAARQAGVLGPSVLGSAHAFDIEVRMGAGAYVCGEETSLLDSLEGKRGQVRAKPPLPAHKGLFGRPTVINNVISLASVPVIIDKGATFYKDFGMGRSRGTIPIQIAGNVKYPGLFEAAFGMTLGEIVDGIGGGTASGRPVRAVQVGGPLGAYFPRALFDTPFDYEAFAAKDGLIGHAGLVVFDDTVDMLKQARFAMEFCGIESCGKCTPCRVGAVRGVETLDRIARNIEPEKQIALVADLCNTMKFGSLCALGGFTPYPVMSALTHFPEDFRPRPMQEAAE